MGHSRNVTTVHAINDERIATCSIDSKVGAGRHVRWPMC